MCLFYGGYVEFKLHNNVYVSYHVYYGVVLEVIRVQPYQIVELLLGKYKLIRIRFQSTDLAHFCPDIPGVLLHRTYCHMNIGTTMDAFDDDWNVLNTC